MREVVAPLANHPIMLGTAIQLFRHLKHQNPSTSDDFSFLGQFLATKMASAPPKKYYISIVKFCPQMMQNRDYKN